MVEFVRFVANALLVGMDAHPTLLIDCLAVGEGGVMGCERASVGALVRRCCEWVMRVAAEESSLHSKRHENLGLTDICMSLEKEPFGRGSRQTIWHFQGKFNGEGDDWDAEFTPGRDIFR